MLDPQTSKRRLLTDGQCCTKTTGLSLQIEPPKLKPRNLTQLTWPFPPRRSTPCARCRPGQGKIITLGDAQRQPGTVVHNTLERSGLRNVIRRLSFKSSCESSCDTGQLTRSKVWCISAAWPATDDVAYELTHKNERPQMLRNRINYRRNTACMKCLLTKTFDARH